MKVYTHSSCGDSGRQFLFSKLSWMLRHPPRQRGKADLNSGGRPVDIAARYQSGWPGPMSSAKRIYRVRQNMCNTYQWLDSTTSCTLACRRSWTDIWSNHVNVQCKPFHFSKLLLFAFSLGLNFLQTDLTWPQVIEAHVASTLAPSALLLPMLVEQALSASCTRML